MQHVWESLREGAKEPVKLVSGVLIAAAAVGVLGTGVLVVESSFADTLPTSQPTAPSPTASAPTTPTATSAASPTATSTVSEDPPHTSNGGAGA